MVEASNYSSDAIRTFFDEVWGLLKCLTTDKYLITQPEKKCL
jgi:hypothetical protein